MSSFELDIDQYLTEEDKRQICREKFADVARMKCKDDFERIITNSAYSIVRDEVDKVFDGKMQEFLIQRVEKVVKELSAFTVFNKPDAWDKTSSKGYDLLQQAVQDVQPLIVGRVVALIEGMSAEDLSWYVQGPLVAAILEKLKS